MTDTVLGSTIIIHSNSRSVLLIELTGSLLLLWDVSFPAPSSSSDFGWFLMRRYKHSENCKVGGHQCLPKSTTGKKLKNC